MQLLDHARTLLSIFLCVTIMWPIWEGEGSESSIHHTPISWIQGCLKVALEHRKVEYIGRQRPEQAHASMQMMLNAMHS